MTPAEAVRLIEALGLADVTDVRMTGGDAEVDMNVAGAAVKHSLRMPSADQVVSWRRSAFRVLDLPYNQRELRVNSDAGAKLYDQLGGKSADYANGIPAPHKDAAVRAVIEYVDRTMGPRNDEPSF
jgi:hypothetical protein